jgi:hypothetical protein
MKRLSLFFIFFLISCDNSNEVNISLIPDFGFHVDRIVSVPEGQTIVGQFTASIPEGASQINYSSSNIDLSISSEGLLSFNILPDYETLNEHLTVITASNDSGSDQINVKVKILDTLCEFNTAAVFDSCTFE